MSYWLYKNNRNTARIKQALQKNDARDTRTTTKK